jgi:hypothetical protein
METDVSEPQASEWRIGRRMEWRSGLEEGRGMNESVGLRRELGCPGSVCHLPFWQASSRRQNSEEKKKRKEKKRKEKKKG